MTPTQIALVRASYERIAPHSDAIGASVHECVLRFHPELQDLFQSELGAQADKLMSMLGTIVDSLDRRAQWLPLFHALGRRYALDGVRDEHYDIVAGALVTALASKLGPAFKVETEAAWTTLCAEIAATMIAGARGQALAS